MSKPFASSADTEVQRARVVELAEGVFGYISNFDPNTGWIVGPEGCLAIDCRATPYLAREMLQDIEAVTDKPVTRLFLTHYHAVRVMGRAAFADVHTVIASRGTLDLIRERGQQDFASEVRRFPRLFSAVEEVPGLTYPTQTFEKEVTLWMGEREVRLLHLGRGHTQGDSVAWLPQERILFAGDLVEDQCALYCGDAHICEWRETLLALELLAPRIVVPGRGSAIVGEENVRKAFQSTAGFLNDLLRLTEEAMNASHPTRKSVFDYVYENMTPVYGGWPIYEHCIPFNVSRAWDELHGEKSPAIWTAERDQEMWKALQG